MPSELYKCQILKLDSNKDANGRIKYTISGDHVFWKFGTIPNSYVKARCVRNWRGYKIFTAQNKERNKNHDYYVLDKKTGEMFSYLYTDNPNGTKLSFLEEELNRILY